MSANAPPKPMPPPAARKSPPPASPAAEPVSTAGRFAVATGRVSGAQRVVIYGPGGVGKSSLAALAPRPVFLDIETGTEHLDVARISDIATWGDLRACVQSSMLDAYETIVIDSATRAEEMAVAATLAFVKNEKGQTMTSIEGYGWGKGFQHVYDTWLPLLSDLDRHIRAGRNVVLVSHACTANVPNPSGENFIRYEPRLQTTNNGKAAIRSRVVEWADHVLFIGYDVSAKDGKGVGGGTRTIWTSELPDHIAKSRTVAPDLPFQSAADGDIWAHILGGK